jgi:hypothetical protein
MGHQRFAVATRRASVPRRMSTASNVNYRAGADITNTAIVKLNATGNACIYTFAATHLLADVNGYVTG